MRLPPLVTTGSPADTTLLFLQNNFQGVTVGPSFLLILPGSVGLPNTQVLFGGVRTEEDVRSGGRLTAGMWLDSDHCFGVEAGGFFLEPISKTFTANSNGSVVLARPFFDTLFGAEEALPIAAPPQTVTSQAGPRANTTVTLSVPGSSGSISVSSSSEFWGAEVNGRAALMRAPWYHVDALAGFRYLQLKEDLITSSVSNTTFPLVGNTLLNTQGDVVGTTITVPQTPATLGVLDSFVTRNDFYGGQIGVQAEAERGIWFVDVRAKMAFGVTHQVVEINGATAAATATGLTVVPSGLLAVASNSGHHSRCEFGLVPEVGVNVGCEILHHVRVTFGYSMLYMRDNVVRPGDQIDRFVNSAQVPAFGSTNVVAPSHVFRAAPLLPAGEARPAFFFRNDDFWAQGINAGLELSF
jgi:hypothetical protein